MAITDFILKDQNDNDFHLGAARREKLFLSFHPLAWTSICTTQMKDLDARHDAFMAKGLLPIGVSVDNQHSKKPWAESMGLKKMVMLADFWPHGALAQELGCFIQKAGISGRQHYIIDTDGSVLWTKRNEIPEVPDFDAMLKEIQV
ncbi:MAG: redoxin domain-containing protein [Planctomycetes bacterium]|nr:redoxin domain-containing protein [Planctomycetota bacterium]